MVLNQTRSIQSQERTPYSGPTAHNIAMMAIEGQGYSASEMNLLSASHGATPVDSNNSRSTPALPSMGPVNQNTPDGVHLSTCTPEALSCPSNIGSWKYNGLYIPPRNGEPPVVAIAPRGYFAEDLSNSGYNSSMSVLMGSTENSMAYYPQMAFTSFPGYRSRYVHLCSFLVQKHVGQFKFYPCKFNQRHCSLF